MIFKLYYLPTLFMSCLFQGNERQSLELARHINNHAC